MIGRWESRPRIQRCMGEKAATEDWTEDKDVARSCSTENRSGNSLRGTSSSRADGSATATAVDCWGRLRRPYPGAEAAVGPRGCDADRPQQLSPVQPVRLPGRSGHPFCGRRCSFGTQADSLVRKRELPQGRGDRHRRSELASPNRPRLDFLRLPGPGARERDQRFWQRHREEPCVQPQDSARRARHSQRRDGSPRARALGGRPVGVEYAGAVIELLRAVLRKDFREAELEAKVVLLEAGPRILPLFDERLAASAARSLQKLGVDVRTGTALKAIDQAVVELADGSRIEPGTVIWAAGVKASPLGGTLGVPLTSQARVPVTPSLRVRSLPNVFVIGDLAAHADLPMLARPAIEEGEYVAKAIHSLMLDREPEPFVYKDPGIMAIVGRGSGIAQIGPFRLRGFIGWLFWLTYHILIVDTLRARFTALINWAALFLLREPPIRLDVSAERHQAPD